MRALAWYGFAFLVVPVTVAYAGFFSVIGEMFSKAPLPQQKTINSQNVALLQAPLSPKGEGGIGGADVPVVGGTALLADAGPNGGLPEVDEPGVDHGAISLYEVRPGDTLASIASLFGVSVNTILWANNLSRGTKITIGQTLVILPVSGVQHIVKAGDTISSIAKKYKGDPEEISIYNGLDEDAKLMVGQTIIIPDGEIAPVPTATRPATSKLRGAGGPPLVGYYIAPLSNYRKTQGLHGYNGIDLAAYYGAPVMAAADGDVIVARQGGYNGGYGSYVVIRHDNGTQTLYGHLSQVKVSVGQRVSQGFVIGSEGSTGRSTGPHLHFEVRGAQNPF